VIELLDPETLDEHVEALMRTSQVEARPAADGTVHYAVTDWLREGLAPLAAAARHERHDPSPDVLPPDRLDVEAAFQLGLPLVTPPAGVGAMVRIERGAIASCGGMLDERTDAWASGGAVEWLDTVIDPTVWRLEVGGDTRLAEALIGGLHKRPFGVPVR
jgi:hypothetical protein